MSNIAIVININKTGSEETSKSIKDVLSRHDVNFETFDIQNINKDSFDGFDLCITIGGDGTVLCAISALIKNDIPVLPIHTGSLGFLTSSYDKNDTASIWKLISGENLKISKKFIEITRSNGEVLYAFNDVWFKNSAPSRIARLNLHCNDQFVNNYNADGLIICSSAGSTAYNLSAGGPIASDNIECLIATPLLAHSLNNRSMIFGNTSSLKISNNNKYSTIYMCYDNANCIRLDKEETINIKLSKKYLTLLYKNDYNFYTTLQNKLKW